MLSPLHHALLYKLSLSLSSPGCSAAAAVSTLLLQLCCCNSAAALIINSRNYLSIIGEHRKRSKSLRAIRTHRSSLQSSVFPFPIYSSYERDFLSAERASRLRVTFNDPDWDRDTVCSVSVTAVPDTPVPKPSFWSLVVYSFFHRCSFPTPIKPIARVEKIFNLNLVYQFIMHAYITLLLCF